MERLLAWYRVGSSVGAVAALVVANLVPLVGVLWFGWSMWTILAIYWLENGIVGLFNVFKLATVGAGGLVTIPFFTVHYGIFWLVHGVFVWTLPTFMAFGGDNPPVVPILDPSLSSIAVLDAAPRPDSGIELGNVVFAGIFLFLSHGVSFVFNFLRGGEYRTTTPAQLMFGPYGRVVILHLTILFGAFAVAILGISVLPLVILVGLKTALDLAFHLREHRTATS